MNKDVFAKIREWVKKIKEKKDTYIILFLAGVLLFIIALPVKQKDTNQDDLFGKSENDNVGLKEIDLEENKQTDQNVEQTEFEEDIYINYMEEKLEHTLAMVEGVGTCKVMITVNSSREEIIEKDQPKNQSMSTEKDGENSRNTSEYQQEDTTVYQKDHNGNEVPYVIKELLPKVEGVLVVAAGASNPTVKKNITDVIQSLFGIEPHKIVVVKMKS